MSKRKSWLSTVLVCFFPVIVLVVFASACPVAASYGLDGSDSACGCSEAKTGASQAALVASDDIQTAEALCRLSDNYERHGNYRQCEPLLTLAVSLYDKAGKADDRGLISALYALGDCQLRQGKRASARHCFLRALGLDEEKTKAPPVPPGSPAGKAGKAGKGEWLEDELWSKGESCRRQGLVDDSERLLRLAMFMEKNRAGSKSLKLAEIEYALGVDLLLQHKFEEAEKSFKKALEARLQGSPGDERKIADSKFSLGVLYQAQGRVVEAQPLLCQALELRLRVLETGDPKLAATYFKLGQNYWLQGKYALSEPLLEKAMECGQRASRRDEALIAETYYDLAWGKLQQRSYEEAAELFQKSLHLREKILKSDDPLLSGTAFDLGRNYLLWGKFDLAVAPLERALATRQKSLSAWSPEIADCLDLLGCAYFFQDKYDLAAPLFDSAVKIRQKTGRPDDRQVISSLNNLAWNCLKQGDYERSCQYFGQVMDGCLARDPAGARESCLSMCKLSKFYCQQGKMDAAVAFLNAALLFEQKSLQPDDPLLAMTYMDLGDTYFLFENYPDAEQSYERALVASQDASGLEESALAETWEKLGHTLLEQGRYEEAEDPLIKALIMQEHVRGKGSAAVGRCLGRLGDVLRCLGNYRQAMQYYDLALSRSKSEVLSGGLFLGRGLACDLIGEPKGAQADFQAALSCYRNFLERNKSSADSEQVRQICEKLEKQIALKKIFGCQCPDYLLSVKGFRWTSKSYPVLVFIADGQESNGFCPDMKEDIVRALDEWVSGSGKRISYRLTSEEAGAGIVIERVKSGFDMEPSCIGRTRYESLKLQGGLIAGFRAHVRICCLENHICQMSPRQAKALHAVFLHELGHALGFVGHSPNGKDVMYWINGAQTLSARDKATMAGLYR